VPRRLYPRYLYALVRLDMRSQADGIDASQLRNFARVLSDSIKVEYESRRF
jgi:hypothetical protein